MTKTKCPDGCLTTQTNQPQLSPATEPGAFIVFEGGEGSGKTTQINLLGRELRQHGFRVFQTLEPGGGGPIPEKIRAILKDPANRDMAPETELFLFLAARSQHVKGTLVPRLKQGEIILCDRFYGSTLAYQHLGRGLFNYNQVVDLNNFATGGLEPNLTIVLDIEPARGLTRKGADAQNDRFDSEKIGFHEKVRRAYLAIALRELNWVVVNADQNEKEVFQNIWSKVSRLLNV